ncbi:vWA domain-containing protein [Aridibaculum aurantiacum]|uniref:vWA domain-containing protein n=1 Tax=Aridibaculum aurantiacum TaxID=2810307 RepID=UPI001A96A827|nr:VWA domain-containing protein [Aridibaculum aurantiacum]
MRGEVKDQQGQPLVGVRITLASTGEVPFFSGNLGTFGIPTSKKIDTISLTLEGFEKLVSPVVTQTYSSFVMKMLPRKISSNKMQLASYTKNLLTNEKALLPASGESYAATIENQFLDVKEYPETGFALHVDRASYSNIRRFINNKSKPPPYAVRIEEMLNYFNFNTSQDEEQKEVIDVKSTIISCPWQPGNQLLFLNLHAKKLDLDRTPPSNLVFLIDVSGSMDHNKRLPLIKSGFKLLVENLRAIDTVSIITYGSLVGINLEPTSGAEKQKIIDAIEGLQPAGSTPGEAAIRIAYKIAASNFIPHGNNRVILATDGDFNVGQQSEKELEELIGQQKQSGIYLTCLGVGMGNYKDSKLEALARRGNGNFAYLDTDKEAEKVLVEEFAQTVYTVANNVQANICFNSSRVKSYRLIGFDNKRDAVKDSTSQVEGGDLGSGHSLLAVFEIVPEQPHLPKTKEPAGNLQVSYKLPSSAGTIIKDFALDGQVIPFEKSDSSLRFATAVIMFGSLLKQSPFAKPMDWNMLENIVNNAASKTNLLQQEFVQLVEHSKKMYKKTKNRRSFFRS